MVGGVFTYTLVFRAAHAGESASSTYWCSAAMDPAVLVRVTLRSHRFLHSSASTRSFVHFVQLARPYVVNVSVDRNGPGN